MKSSEFDLIIEPGRAEKNYWRDLWRYRELFYILSWRDLKVRYKQTVVGVAWSVIRPLLTMIIFTLVFGRLANAYRRISPLPDYGICRIITLVFLLQFAERSK